MEEIKVLLQEKCNYVHSPCKEVAEKLIIYHENGGMIDNNFFSAYLDYLYGRDMFYKCINHCTISIPIIKKILGYLEPKDTDLLILSSIKYINGEQLEIFKIITNRGTIIPTAILYNAIKNKNLNLALYLINFVNPDVKCLEEACLCQNSGGLVNAIIDQKIEVSDKAFKNAVISGNDGAVKIFLQIGINPNTMLMEFASLHKNKEIIELFLKYGVTPTEKHFYALLTNCYLSMGKNKENFKAKLISEILDLFIEYGYKITYQQVFELLCKGCYVNDIGRFNIVFDDQFSMKCSELGYYPYDLSFVKPSLGTLLIECKKVNNVANIKKIISDELKPNQECLKQACEHKSNLQNIKFLIENCELKPDIECLKIIAKHIGNQSLIYLLNHIK